MECLADAIDVLPCMLLTFLSSPTPVGDNSLHPNPHFSFLFSLLLCLRGELASRQQVQPKNVNVCVLRRVGLNALRVNLNPGKMEPMSKCPLMWWF